MKRIRFSAEGSGDGTKRRQVKRACSKCRKSKRACRHVPNEGVPSSPPTDPVEYDLLHASPPETPVALTLGENISISPVTNNVTGTCEPSNPDRQLLEARPQSQPSSTSLPIPYAGASSAHSLLLSSLRPSPAPSIPATMNGDLNPSSSEAIITEHLLPPARRLRPSLQDIKAGPSERRPGVGPTYLPMVVRAVLPYLEIECLDVLPPPEDLNALIQIYQREIHPLLPIVDFDTTALSGPAGRDRPASVVLRQAICLAACKSGAARPHLRLRVLREEEEEGVGEEEQQQQQQEEEENSRPFVLQTTRDFANRLFGSLKVGLDIGLVEDRLELVQLLALMTFHSYGLDGDEEVARLCGQAVHYAYSAGLHQPSALSPSSSSSLPMVIAGTTTNVSEVRRIELMCSIFALDKIIAMVTGRPAVAHERETYLPSPDSSIWESLSPGIRMLFRLSQMLDRVLGLYRSGFSSSPASSGQQEEQQQHEGVVGGWCIWEEWWPDFEELGRECGIHKLEFPLQATLEVLYLAVAMLSYRQAPSPVGDDYNFTTTTDTGSIPTVSPILPSTLRNARARQRHAIQQISSLPTLELCMLPYIPYAVSLSLSTSLSSLRHNSLESTRRRAKAEIETSLETLEKLGERYWLAESMSKTGRKLYKDRCL